MNEKKYKMTKLNAQMVKLMHALHSERPNPSQGRPVTLRQFIKLYNILNERKQGAFSSEELVNQGKANILFCGHFCYPKE